MKDATLHLHLGGDPCSLARLAIAEIKRVPRNGMHVRDMPAILRMAAVFSQLAADLHEALESTTGGLELPYWRLDTVQLYLSITPSNSEPAVRRTVSELEHVSKVLASVTQAGRHQPELFGWCVTALTPWANMQITQPIAITLKEVPQPA